MGRRHFNKRTGPYLRDLGDALGLRDWHFHLMHEPATGTTALARVNKTDNRREACLWLCAWWRHLPRSQQRMILVHELIHLHLWEMTAWINADDPGPVAAALGTLPGEMLKRQLHAADEQAVDALAVSIARLLPLPPKRKGH